MNSANAKYKTDNNLKNLPLTKQTSKLFNGINFRESIKTENSSDQIVESSDNEKIFFQLKEYDKQASQYEIIDTIDEVSFFEIDELNNILDDVEDNKANDKSQKSFEIENPINTISSTELFNNNNDLISNIEFKKPSIIKTPEKTTSNEIHASESLDNDMDILLNKYTNAQFFKN